MHNSFDHRAIAALAPVPGGSFLSSVYIRRGAFFVLMAGVFWPLCSKAQKIVERAYTLPKAERKFIDGMTVDSTGSRITLRFNPGKSEPHDRTTSVLRYTFDDQLSLIESEPAEGHGKKINRPTMHRTIAVAATTVSRKLVMKQWETEKRWYGFEGLYAARGHSARQTRPTNKEGHPYELVRNFYNGHNGESIALVRDLQAVQHYYILRTDTLLHTTVMFEHTFQNPVLAEGLLVRAASRSTGSVPGSNVTEDVNGKGLVFLFAPSASRLVNDSTHTYVAWRTDPNGVLLNNVTIQVTAGAWMVNDAILCNKDLYLIGTANDGVPDGHIPSSFTGNPRVALNNPWARDKPHHFLRRQYWPTDLDASYLQVCRITPEGKAVVAATHLSEMIDDPAALSKDGYTTHFRPEALEEAPDHSLRMGGQIDEWVQSQGGWKAVYEDFFLLSTAHATSRDSSGYRIPPQ